MSRPDPRQCFLFGVPLGDMTAGDVLLAWEYCSSLGSTFFDGGHSKPDKDRCAEIAKYFLSEMRRRDIIRSYGPFSPDMALASAQGCFP